ncbi:MAG: diphosphomevalonate decarboxylase, partial [Spirochaetaceae bacterium]|nr:diphosphomevalonate decarboxylase [Spirochaetaceae bacterium]
MMNLSGFGASSAHPSLALIKYWGKADSIRNLPATPSLAVTLDGLTTRTEAALSPILDGGFKPDAVSIGGEIQDIRRFEAFFKEFRRIIAARQPERGRFSISAVSSSDFPTAAGLASSSSGFAALSCACAEAAGVLLSREELSSLARTGSASAARSIYGGFTRLDAGSSHAVQIFDEHWWPEFRIIVLELENEPKAISSRQAMELSRITSPFYDSWVRDSEYLMEKALGALKEKDLKTLGPLIRNS